MAILISVLQVLFGLWHLTGGIYMSTNYEWLITPWAAATLPGFFWILLAIVQILLSLGLVLSVMKKWKKWAPVSALGLAAIDLLGIGFYSAYTGSGVLWAILPAVLLAFIAYQRRK
jgi:hypothetical protein